ncbi:hypothetical protein CYMTET_8519 [Cymbomonas tetramitiformis]|uniref:Uncharacterized protein n=1 Tax=Cymbomonas tetramitiformis TaxID=36881 RepID=A0AAE0LFS0_9CHLO|nr:hypothetical protein CYMTET_8519 [Cymbomonas tetramitiformis]
MHCIDLHEDVLADMFQKAYDSRDAVAFHSLCIAHGKPPGVECADEGDVPEDIFVDYDAEAAAGDSNAATGVRAGLFVPTEAPAAELSAAAANIDNNIYPVAATQQISAGPPLPPTSRLFADLVLEGSGVGGAPKGTAHAMGLFSTADESTPELLPDDDDDNDVSEPLQLPPAPAVAEPGVLAASAPSATFSRCGIGAPPIGAGMFLTAALLCTVICSAAGMPTAAVVSTENELPQHFLSALGDFHFTSALIPHTAFATVNGTTSFDMPHVLFACAPAHAGIAPVVCCDTSGDTPPCRIHSGYDGWTYGYLLDWFWTLGLATCWFLVSGIFWCWLLSSGFLVNTDIFNCGYLCGYSGSELHLVDHFESG